MPTRDTKVVAARVPIALAKAIEAEAVHRGVSVNELVLKAIDALYSVGSKVQKTTPKDDTVDPDGSPIPWGK